MIPRGIGYQLIGFFTKYPTKAILGNRPKRGDPIQKTLLKPREASAHFDIPLSTIYFWYRMGNIDGIKVNGRCLRIFSKSLQEFLESRIAVGW